MESHAVKQNGFSSSSLEGIIMEASKVKGQQVVSIPRNGLNNLIRSISDKQEEAEPFYILDLGVVVRLMEKWKQNLPNVKPFFAYKCNNEPALVVALATLGANFDCASRDEIESVLGLGVSADRIIYANPCKAESHIKYAASVGVKFTTFDSEEEVNKMKRWHPQCGLVLRLKVDDETSWRQLGTKFGALPEEIVPLLQCAHQAGMKVAGVSFHVGSKASMASTYRDALAAARVVFDAAAQLNMPQMHLINIGGGFKANPLFDDIGATVNDAIKEFFPDETPLQVIAEPGRYLCETAFTLVTNVFGKRVRGEKREYWIDDGIYGSFNIPVYDRSFMLFKPIIRNREEGGLVFPSTVFGPSCDSQDIVAKDCTLPELQVNDLIVFYNMGAYTTSIGTKFNGFNSFAVPTYLAYSPKN